MGFHLKERRKLTKVKEKKQQQKTKTNKQVLLTIRYNLIILFVFKILLKDKCEK